MNRSGALAVKGQTISLNESNTGALISDTATVENTGIGIAIVQNADIQNSTAFILLSQRVNGNVETVLDTRGTLLAGLTAGMTVGLLFLVGKMIKGNR
jgi:hypothetical protein